MVPVTTQSSVAYSQLPDDVLQFYQDAGVDSIAREVNYQYFIFAVTLSSKPAIVSSVTVQENIQLELLLLNSRQFINQD